MSQYGAPEQSRSPAPGGMGYGQASQQSQYGAPPQGQYGQEQVGRPEQRNETFALQSQEGQQNQQGQANQTGQEQQGQQGQQGQQQGNTQGQGEDEKQRPGEGALQAAGKPGPAASHPHSRFHQDPHHHAAMSAFHKIANHGLTPDHIHSLVHVGSLGLAMLAKNAGMTAGHEPEEEEPKRP